MERFNKLFIVNKLYSFIAFAVALGFGIVLLVKTREPVSYMILNIITDYAQLIRCSVRLAAIIYMLLPVLFREFPRKAYFPVFVLLGLCETLLPLQQAVYEYYTDEEGLGYLISVSWVIFSVGFSIAATTLSCDFLLANRKAPVVLTCAALLFAPLIFYQSNSAITNLKLEVLSALTTTAWLYFSIAFFNNSDETKREIYYRLPLDN